MKTSLRRRALNVLALLGVGLVSAVVLSVIIAPANVVPVPALSSVLLIVVIVLGEVAVPGLAERLPFPHTRKRRQATDKYLGPKA